MARLGTSRSRVIGGAHLHSQLAMLLLRMLCLGPRDLGHLGLALDSCLRRSSTCRHGVEHTALLLALLRIHLGLSSVGTTKCDLVSEVVLLLSSLRVEPQRLSKVELVQL